MSRPQVFLERRRYRQRRVREGSRLLPVVGLFLFLMPLIWTAAPGRSLSTAAGGLYLFAGWGVLIACAFVFSRVHLRSEEAEPDDEQ